MTRPERLAHVVINTTDLEQAERFYCEGLGMSPTGRQEGRMVFLYFGPPGEEPHPYYHDLAIFKVDQPAPDNFRQMSGVNHVALRMGTPEDVAEAAERLRSLGYRVLKEGVHKEDGYRYAYVQDPDRNVVELVCPTVETKARP